MGSERGWGPPWAGMDPKLWVFSRLPEAAKVVLTHGYIHLRKYRERLESILRPAPRRTGVNPRVVYVTGFPRTGTTLLKYYFADHPGFRAARFDPAGYFVSWRRTEEGGPVLVDKSNHYIYAAETIFKALGENAAICCVFRDPRDSFVSLLRFPEAREVPRTARFWPRWWRLCHGFLRFASDTQYAHRIFALRYEDLVRFPREAKQAYLRWLGVEADLDSLATTYRNPHPDEGTRDKVHEHSEVLPYGLESWKSAGLGPDERSAMEAWRERSEVRELMESLGYFEAGFGPVPVGARRYCLFRPGE